MISNNSNIFKSRIIYIIAKNTQIGPIVNIAIGSWLFVFACTRKHVLVVWCMWLTSHKTNKNFNSNRFYLMIFGKNLNQDESDDMLDCMKPLIIDRALIHSNPNNFYL